MALLQFYKFVYFFILFEMHIFKAHFSSYFKMKFMHCIQYNCFSCKIRFCNRFIRSRNALSKATCSQINLESISFYFRSINIYIIFCYTVSPRRVGQFGGRGGPSSPIFRLNRQPIGLGHSLTWVKLQARGCLDCKHTSPQLYIPKSNKFR